MALAVSRPVNSITTDGPDRIEDVTEPAQVTLSGAVSGRYLVTEKRPSGELTLVPDTSIRAIRERQGTEAISPEEFEAAFSGLPTDDEG